MREYTINGTTYRSEDLVLIPITVNNIPCWKLVHKNDRDTTLDITVERLPEIEISNG